MKDKGRPQVAKWKTLSSTYVSTHPYMTLRKDRRVAAEFGEHDFYILEFRDWVNVVPVTSDGMVVLVRQFRQGINAENLEIPGGLVDEGEQAQQAALRELAEETGFVAKNIQLLATVSTNPAIQNNWCHLYLATDCSLQQQQNLDATESIVVEQVPLAQLESLMKTGQIHHSLNCLAINLALQQLDNGHG